jgi:hypothetical protein
MAESIQTLHEKKAVLVWTALWNFRFANQQLCLLVKAAHRLARHIIPGIMTGIIVIAANKT